MLPASRAIFRALSRPLSQSTQISRASDAKVKGLVLVLVHVVFLFFTSASTVVRSELVFNHDSGLVKNHFSLLSNFHYYSGLVSEKQNGENHPFFTFTTVFHYYSERPNVGYNFFTKK